MDYAPATGAGWLALITSTSGTVFFMSPSNLPSDKLTEFRHGFDDVLVSRAGLESA
ncbi:hypothetical protein [Streptomyces sp. NPDC001665]